MTSSVKPKLLTDNPDKDLSQDRYAVCFEETIILESSDLQLDDEGKAQQSLVTASANA